MHDFQIKFYFLFFLFSIFFVFFSIFLPFDNMCDCTQSSGGAIRITTIHERQAQILK